MADVIECPACGQRYPFKSSLAGQRVKCKKCGHVFQIAAAAEPQPVSTPSNFAVNELLDEAFGDAGTVEPAMVASKPLSATLPRRQKGGLRRRMSARELLANGKLMLAVCALAIVALFTCGFAGHILVGFGVFLIGLAIAAVGLRPYPAPSTSVAGTYFTIGSVGSVLIWVVISLSRMFSEVPKMATLGARTGFYTGVIATLSVGLILSAATIAFIAFLMRRFGFFRPAAWIYMLFLLISVPWLLYVSPAGLSDREPVARGAADDQAKEILGFFSPQAQTPKQSIGNRCIVNEDQSDFPLQATYGGRGCSGAGPVGKSGNHLERPENDFRRVHRRVSRG